MSGQVIQKPWNYCNVLRYDGMSYGDDVEQLTCRLFLKMADERSRPPYHQPGPIPAAYAWPALIIATRLQTLGRRHSQVRELSCR